MKRLKGVISTIMFIVLFLAFFANATYIFRDKGGAKQIYPFHMEQADSIDVIFLGSSHMYRSIQPMELWNDYGIASFNLGSSEQSIPLSYYLLKDAIERQHPKIVVLDVYMLIVAQKDYTHERVHQVVDNMGYSAVKYEAITDIIPKEEWIYFFLNIGQFHTRWKVITENDFLPITDVTKGSDFSGGNTVLEPVQWVDGKMPVPEVPLEYLCKIEELCEENDIELVFSLMPYRADESHMKIFNSFEELAVENGWNYINCIDCMDDMKISWSDDFADGGHLNSRGSIKASVYWGELLSAEYGVPDHRYDEFYEEWDSVYNEYVIFRDSFDSGY